MFRCLYEQIFDIFDLPALTEQPRVDFYADGTFSINWWGEIVYCKKTDQFLDHLAVLKDRYKSKSHKNFKENEAQIYENFKKKVEEVRMRLNQQQPVHQDEENKQLLAEKEIKIREQEQEIQGLLREIQQLRQEK